MPGEPPPAPPPQIAFEWWPWGWRTCDFGTTGRSPELHRPCLGRGLRGPRLREAPGSRKKEDPCSLESAAFPPAGISGRSLVEIGTRFGRGPARASPRRSLVFLPRSSAKSLLTLCGVGSATGRLKSPALPFDLDCAPRPLLLPLPHAPECGRRAVASPVLAQAFSLGSAVSHVSAGRSTGPSPAPDLLRCLDAGRALQKNRAHAFSSPVSRDAAGRAPHSGRAAGCARRRKGPGHLQMGRRKRHRALHREQGPHPARRARTRERGAARRLRRGAPSKRSQ